jgi:hypothetical protein
MYLGGLGVECRLGERLLGLYLKFHFLRFLHTDATIVFKQATTASSSFPVRHSQ